MREGLLIVIEELLKNNELFMLFVEQIGSVSIFDLQGRYVYVNKIWEELQQRKFEEVKGVDVESIVPYTQVRKVLQSGAPVFGFPIPDQNDQVWVLNYFPLYHKGALVGCAMVSIFNNKRQVTELMSTMQKLKNQITFHQETLGHLQGAKYNMDNIIGVSPAVQQLRKAIQQAARSHSNVLIEGETGSGKELVAHSVHSLSGRAMHPFVTLNCAAIPMELAESELFGYASGAFTGAKREGKKGKFELAHEGSLFLDEVNQLPYLIQPKLLRALQEHEIERVGGDRTISLDVRIIAASNQPLEELVKEQKFREDLYYRLNVYKIKVPPLRDRIEDIPLLAKHYMHLLNSELGTTVTGITPAACECLKSYYWPGNIRELRNVLEKAINIRLHGVLDEWDFTDILQGKRNPAKQLGHDYLLSQSRYQDAKDEFDRAIVTDALQKCGRNKKRAAELLGLSRAMLYRKIEKYHISE